MRRHRWKQGDKTGSSVLNSPSQELDGTGALVCQKPLLPRETSIGRGHPESSQSLGFSSQQVESTLFLGDISLSVL